MRRVLISMLLVFCFNPPMASAQTVRDWTYRTRNGRQQQITGVAVSLSEGQLEIQADSAKKHIPLALMAESDRKAAMIQFIGSGVVMIKTLDFDGDETGFGSGFLTGDDKLVTNYHVIRGAASVEIEFRDSKQRISLDECLVVDRKNDLAILTIEPPTAAHRLDLARPSELAPGSEVWAIGHPRGLKDTVSWGDVNAVRRTKDLPDRLQSILDADEKTQWIQTNAVITSGSSGGPLLDESGEVVGVNTWIAGPNLGFAVSAANIRPLLARSSSATPIPLPVPPATDESAMRWHSRPIWPLLKTMVDQKEEFDKQIARMPYEQAVDAQSEFHARQRRVFLEFAREKAGTWEGFQSLVFVCQFCTDESQDSVDCMTEACQIAHRKYRNTEWMLDLIGALRSSSLKPSRQYLKYLYQRSKTEKLKAWSGIGLAANLISYLQEGELMSGKSIRNGRSYIETLLADLESNHSEIEGVEEACALLDAQLEATLVGQEPLPVDGIDVDGKRFQLSQYRGKVIVLDFFANWCPHCKVMYPHERELVKKYADEPFVLLGVNTESQEVLEQLVRSGTVTWPCWADGPDGPIAQRWEIDAYPTVILIGADYTIRKVFSGNPGDKLEEGIKQLLSETKTR